MDTNPSVNASPSPRTRRPAPAPWLPCSWSRWPRRRRPVPGRRRGSERYRPGAHDRGVRGRPGRPGPRRRRPAGRASFTRPTVKQARADAAAAMTRVVAALKAAGLADKDIQTSTLSLSPNFDYNAGNAGKLTGYTLSNAASATVRDLDRVGDALDGRWPPGRRASTGSPSGSTTRPLPRRRARTAAMARAKATTDQLAAAARVHITGVASVSETSATPPPVYFAGDRAAAPSAAGGATRPRPGRRGRCHRRGDLPHQLTQPAARRPAGSVGTSFGCVLGADPAERTARESSTHLGQRPYDHSAFAGSTGGQGGHECDGSRSSGWGCWRRGAIASPRHEAWIVGVDIAAALPFALLVIAGLVGIAPLVMARVDRRYLVAGAVVALLVTWCLGIAPTIVVALALAATLGLGIAGHASTVILPFLNGC